MKKTAFILAVLMGITVISGGVRNNSLGFPIISSGITAEAEKLDGFEYTVLENDTIEITGCDESVTKIIIPSEIDGKAVTSIGCGAFENRKRLRDIIIPDSVISIGNLAFYGTAWYEAQSDGEVYLGKWFIKYKGEMPDNTSVTIKDGTTGIADKAFSNCSGLTGITIPDGVTSIGGYAFSYCTGLTEITIPDGVEFIGVGAFSDCTELTEITVPDSVVCIGEWAFYATAWYDAQPDGCAYLGKWLIVCKGKGKMPDNTSVTIKDGTTGIAGTAFLGCAELTKIIIPDSVTSIGDSAFCRCGLKEITIPDSVTSIGDYAFEECTGLTQITISDGVASIGRSAFGSCTELTGITIPDSVTSIGKSAFGYCGDRFIHKMNNFKITGYEGTAAQIYAEENGFEFISLGTAQKQLAGDIDGNGEITSSDALMILQAVTQLTELDDKTKTLADLDYDGGITSADALIILQYVVGLVSIN